MADVVVRHSDLQQLFRDVSERLHQVVDFDLIVFTLHNPANNKMLLRYSESSGSHFESDAELRRYEALLQMADVVVCHSDLQQLFRDVSERLHQVVDFDLIVFTLHNPANNKMLLRYSESSGSNLEFLDELPIEEAPTGWAWLNQTPLIIPDVGKETRFQGGLKMIRNAGIRSYFCFPVTLAGKKLGGIGLGCATAQSCAENDQRFLQRVAELVALAIENAQSSGALQQEKERTQMLLKVNAALVSNLDLPELVPAISGFIRNVIRDRKSVV